MPIQYPLILSTLCQRLALGVYIVSFPVVKLMGASLNLSAIALFSLVVFVIGIIFSTIHLGRPTRLLNSFANPKSHLTLEGYMAPFVGLFLFLQAIHGYFIQFSPSLLLVIQILAVVFSLAFIWFTGLVYQLFARPGWKTRLVSINFFLSAAALGSVGTYAWALASGLSDVNYMLNLSIGVLLLQIIGQLAYTANAAKLGYGVAVQPLQGEFKSPYIGWIIFGIAIPVCIIAYLLLTGSSVAAAIMLLISMLIALISWRAYFFLAGKEIKFFPMYQEDITTNF